MITRGVNDIVTAYLGNKKIRYRIVEIEDDTIHAVDIDTNKKYAWDRKTYEVNNHLKIID